MKLLNALLITAIGSLSLFANEPTKPVWFDPSAEACTQNKGILKDGYCDAAYFDAKKVCKAEGHSLPTIEVFEETSIYCGATPYNTYTKDGTSHKDTITRKNNQANKAYRQCVENLGFDRLFSYASLTKEPEWDWKKMKRDIIVHDFSAALSLKSHYTFKTHVRCTN